MGKERHKIVPSAYLVLIRDNKILLQRRFNTGYEDGNYGFVAGHVEEGENFTQGLIREIKEESGIILQKEDVSVIHVMSRNGSSVESGTNERMDIFFKAEKWSGDIENKEPNKCDDLSWFDLDELPKNTIPYIKQALRNIQSEIYYSEYGWENV